MLDATADAVLKTDAQNRIIPFNRAATCLFDYGPDEIIGRGIDVPLPDADPARNSLRNAELTRRLANQALAGTAGLRGPKALSNRELQVFERIGRGRNTREIAEELRLSVHTIESHRESIRAKLELRSGTELMQRTVIWALENSR